MNKKSIQYLPTQAADTHGETTLLCPQREALQRRKGTQRTILLRKNSYTDFQRFKEIGQAKND